MATISGSPTLLHVDDVEEVVGFLKDVSQHRATKVNQVSLRAEHTHAFFDFDRCACLGETREGLFELPRAQRQQNLALPRS